MGYANNIHDMNLLTSVTVSTLLKLNQKLTRGKVMSKTEINEIEINGVTYIKKCSVKAIDQPHTDYVVVRTYSAGVHAGFLKSRKGKEVTLTNTRRLWYWEGAASLSQVAGTGISKPEQCKFPAAIAEITLTEAIEVIPCTGKAKAIIEGVKEWVS